MNRTSEEHVRTGAMWARALAGLLLVLTVCGFSRAQPPNGPLSGYPVQVELQAFGLGNAGRRGDWIGVRLKVKDSGATQREVLVQLRGMDPDGDFPLYTREMTLNPGVDQSIWLYARLPFRYETGDPLVVSVYDAVEGGVKPSGEPWYRAGPTVLGRAVLTPQASAVVKPNEGLFAVLGDRALGLSRYAERPQTTVGDGWHVRGHEVIEPVVGIKPEDMPDRWMGLAEFDAVIWGTGDPSQLRGDRARALRDYVTRGGHLVIIMPEVGQTWTNKQSNDLYDLMPAAAILRNENVDLAPYRPLLNVRKDKPYPTKPGTVYTFRPLPEAQPQEAMEILSGPDGRCVVVRRLVGAGAVTMVGLNINDTAFSQFNVLDTEVLWHRVLGKRGKLTADDANPAGPSAAALFANRAAYYVDKDVPGQISQTGKTAVGVLAGFVVFVAYWLLAGPIGYAVLKSRGLLRHAWVAFAAATGVFTALAWGGATLLRPHRIDAKHLTILDHVYGQPVQRARMWCSILLPTYGERRLSVGDRAEGGSLSAITAWDTPGDEESWGGFPDARGYLVEARAPDIMSVPTRATAKHVQVDWAGGPAWKMPIPTGPDGQGAGEIRVNPKFVPTGAEPMLTGTLTHGLPGTLHDATIIVVQRQTPLRPARSGSSAVSDDLPCIAYAFSPFEWPAGEKDAADLELLTSRSNRMLADTWMRRLLPSTNGFVGINQGEVFNNVDSKTALMGLSFFSMLPPPNMGNNTSTEAAAMRPTAHGLDLGRWFTQPCVIIVGFLGGDGIDAESPVPLKVDGEVVPTHGRTLVRWVYPLPANPPEYGDGATTAPEAAPATPEPTNAG